MTHRNTARRIAAASAVAVLALTGCAAQAGTEKDELKLGVITSLTSFAPWEASWANQSPYLQAVYDTLLKAAPDGTVGPGLATAWEYSDDRTEVTFTLRDDVVFSDGTRFEASVAAENISRFRDGTSENAAFLTGVQAEAISATSLKVTLAEPDPAFLTYMTQNAGLQASPSMWDADDAQTTPIGSGPYILNADETVIGSTYTFNARDGYWDAGSVYFDEIVMTVYGDATALMNAIKGNQVDAAPLQSPTQLADSEAAGFTTQITEINWTGFLLADREGKLNPALGDVRVRQAINYALDREGLVEGLAAGWGTPTTQIFSKGSSAFDAALDDRYPHNIAKAKKLLVEAGYPDGFTLVMPSNNFVPESDFAIYREQLGAVGIDVQWEVTGDDLFGKMLGGAYAAFPMQLQTDRTAWQALQFSMAPWAPWNPFHVADPTIVDHIGVIRMGEDAEADVVKAARALNKHIVEEAWFAPAFRMQSAYVIGPDVRVAIQIDNPVPYLWNIRPAA